MTKKALIILSISFIVNALFVSFAPEYQPWGDAPGYLTLARNVSVGDGFTRESGEPAIYRPPLFAATLGIWFKITGTDSLKSALWFQAIIQSLAVMVSYLLFLAIFGSGKIPFLLAVLLAVNPILFSTVGLVLQENILMLTTTLAALVSVKWIKDAKIWCSVVGGLFWGIATLGKVVTWYVPVLVFLFYLTKKFYKSDFVPLKQVIIFSVVFISIIAPWTVRNYIHFNRFILINDQGGGMLRWVISEGVTGEPEGMRKQFKEKIFGDADAGGIDFLRELEEKNLTSNEKKEQMRKFIIEHPIHIGANMFWNFIHFPQLSRAWFKYVAKTNMSWKLWLIPTIFLQIPLYLGLFFSIAERKRTEILFLVVFYLLYWLQYTLTWGEARFNLPVYPLLMGLGVYGWLLFFKKRHLIRKVN